MHDSLYVKRIEFDDVSEGNQARTHLLSQLRIAPVESLQKSSFDSNIRLID